MIYREYLTEYSKYDSCIKHSITISTDSHRVFKTIKEHIESVCESEDYPPLCEYASNKGGDEE